MDCSVVDCKLCGLALKRVKGVVAEDGYYYHKECLKKFDIEQYKLYVEKEN